MTSTNSMLLRTARWAIVVLLVLVVPAGCGSPERHRLVAPEVTVSPYDPAQGEALFAVVPPRNESGASIVDPMLVGDSLVFALQEVRGLRCLPINRTLDAMRTLGLTRVETPEEGRALAEALGVDGLVLGSITAFDPYEPPVLGLSLALLAREGSLSRGDPYLDTRTLMHQPTEYTYFPRSSHATAPASAVSLHMDASNHEVMAALRRYAEGRVDPDSPYGWRRYLVSMELYLRFASHQAVRSLLERERARLAEAMAGLP